jgi:hypothetical protein
LQHEGYLAPGVENVAKKAVLPKNVEVRYFTKRDELHAVAVADQVREALQIPNDVRLMQVPRTSFRKQPIEVWLPAGV